MSAHIENVKHIGISTTRGVLHVTAKTADHMNMTLKIATLVAFCTLLASLTFRKISQLAVKLNSSL